MYTRFNVSRSSAVGIATFYEPDDRGAGVPVVVESRISILGIVQTGFAAHPASYPMDIVGSFLGSKAAGAWSWQLTFI
jgi:hypothetical protein